MVITSSPVLVVEVVVVAIARDTTFRVMEVSYQLVVVVGVKIVAEK